MTTPKLRFKEFGGDWELDLLGNLVQIKSGYSPSKYELDKSGEMPFLKVEELNNCDKYQEYSRFYTERNSDAVPSKSVVFPKRGAAILNNKVRILRVDALLDSNLMALIPQHSLDAEYLYYLINKIELYKIADTSTIPQINNKHIEPYSIYLPSKEEQTKIASFLSNVDEKISQLTQKHALLSQYKQGMMQKLFSQQIRFKADDGSEFGEWEETVLEKIGIFLKGKGISKADIVENGFTPCIRYGELYTHYGEVISKVISATNLEIENLILSKANDVLIPASGETQIDIATASCVLHDDVALSGDLNIFRTKENGVFLSYLIRSHLKMQIAQLAQGNSVVHLYSSQLKGVRLNLPCLEEQTKIANFLSSIDQKIEVVAQQIEQAKQWKKGLLQQMFV
ncbi:restriction endonuclease subunit S [Acinetobacter johnsonii]|nr:restriction endonuclease subunit S [Acinetobacter johnsonii]MDH1278239.1 restriction endonuclease subunit S [Acinetobacter johnsonii]